jgi:hypothetical protein
MMDLGPYKEFSRAEWIGVDLDGTLAHYSHWTRWNHIGDPIPAMVTRVKAWISIGVQVRIFTARVGFEEDVCKLTGEAFTKEMMSKVIGGWTRQHVGKVLVATATKDFNMRELWDDRAIQVVANTGITIADEYEAQLEALKGKP